MSKKLPKNVFLRRGKYYVRMRINGRDTWKSFGLDLQAATLFAAEYEKRRVSAKITKSNEEVQKLFSFKQRITFEQAADQYIQARHDLKASTLRSYNNYLNNYLIPCFGQVDLCDIRESDVESFLQQLQQKSGFTPKHCNEIIRFARSVCSASERRGDTTRNPFKGARLLREQGGKRKDVDPLSIEEINIVMEALSPKWKPLFTVLAETGMRPSELFALRWSDVDWVHSTVKIRRGRVKGVEDSTKTNSSVRVVNLTSKVMEVLQKIKSDWKVRGIEDYIFVRSDGKPFDKYVGDVWAQAIKKAGLPHRSSYKLRHSYISNCLQAGLDPGWIAKQVGHSNLKMIFEVYGRYIPTEADRNVDKLNDLFSTSSAVTDTKAV